MHRNRTPDFLSPLGAGFDSTTSSYAIQRSPRLDLAERDRGGELLKEQTTDPRSVLISLDRYLELLSSQKLGPLNSSQAAILKQVTAGLSCFQRYTEANISCGVDGPTPHAQFDTVKHAEAVKFAPLFRDNHESGDKPEIVEISDTSFFACASPTMCKIRDQAAMIAGSDIPILLLGESGVGKEVVANLIHRLSGRAQRPFMKVNCAAIPTELLESELFGYEAGAFTGATQSKPGKFELCNKGTILLDEIGDMPAELQAKLLHFTQDQEFSRLGGRTTIKVDLRIMAATNVDVEKAIADKTLRLDLYYRLSGLTLRIPALRERKEEIPILLNQFVNRLADRASTARPVVSARLTNACVAYPWPGNLRELQNFVRRFIALGDEELAIAELRENRLCSGIFSAGLPGRDANESQTATGLKSIVRSRKYEAEAVAIRAALERTNWHRKEAALLLGISYKALLGKIRQIDANTDQGFATSSQALMS
jgi:transcriptional regulator with PAS, ATPase and Fis domain